MSKVILISIDGMRPDGLKACGNPWLPELLSQSSYLFNARTVFPSITLPCHLSLFHSIPPQRHGTLDNTYVTPVRPVSGLFEMIHAMGKTAAMFYGWEPMRAVSRPGSLTAAEFLGDYSFEHTDAMLTDRALEYMRLAHPDFVFLYMAETDDKGGHDTGWMSETYLDYIRCAIDNVRRVTEEFGDEYTILVTADHGGHDRCHGTELPEDMTIPMIFRGKDYFKPGTELPEASILDLAPTAADILQVPMPREWEGHSLVNGRENA